MSWEKYLQERKDKRNKLEEWERSVEKTKNHYEEFANSVGIILQKCGNLSLQAARIISNLIIIVSILGILFTKENWLLYTCFGFATIGLVCSFVLTLYSWIIKDIKKL